MIRDPEPSWNGDRASILDSFHHCAVQMACRPLPLGPGPYLPYPPYLLPFLRLVWSLHLAINGIGRRQGGPKCYCHIAHDVGLRFASLNNILQVAAYKV